MAPNVLFIGPRASGKTTVGRILAARLGRVFVDLDDLVRASFREPTVQEIWAVHGESGWREHEVDALQSVFRSDEQVIALGGGVPCIDAARSKIEEEQARNRAVVLYLRVPVDELVRRLTAETGDRPSLTGRGAIEEVPEIVSRRESTYVAVADVTVDFIDQTPEELAAAFAQALGA